MTKNDVLKRYPRLVAHLICASLGYHTPLSAAGAVLAHINKEPYWCEWYSHMAGFNKTGSYEERMVLVGKNALSAAFVGRHSHKGFMTEYKQAIMLVKAELERSGCTSNMFASWF